MAPIDFSRLWILKYFSRAVQNSTKILSMIALETFWEYHLPGATNFGKKGRAQATIFAQQIACKGIIFFGRQPTAAVLPCDGRLAGGQLCCNPKLRIFTSGLLYR